VSRTGPARSRIARASSPMPVGHPRPERRGTKAPAQPGPWTRRWRQRDRLTTEPVNTGRP